MGPKVSVIIPFYNSKQYLSRCICSVTSQTYSNLEIILVDDGSTDTGSGIVREYCKSDSRIQLIIQENAMEGGARNRGIQEATGSYYAFLDADDWMEPDFIRFMLNKALFHDADLVECSYYLDDESSKIVQIHRIVKEQQEIIVQEKKSAICDIDTVVWNKLYHHTIFRGELFPTGLIYADIGLIPLLAAKSRKILRSPEPFVHYTQRENSLSRVNTLRVLEKLDSCQYLIERFVNRNMFSDYKNELLYRLLKTFAYLSARHSGISGATSKIAHKTVRIHNLYFSDFRFKGNLAYVLIDRILAGCPGVVPYLAIPVLRLYHGIRKITKTISRVNHHES